MLSRALNAVRRVAVRIQLSAAAFDVRVLEHDIQHAPERLRIAREQVCDLRRRLRALQ